LLIFRFRLRYFTPLLAASRFAAAVSSLYYAAFTPPLLIFRLLFVIATLRPDAFSPFSLMPVSRHAFHAIARQRYASAISGDTPRCASPLALFISPPFISSFRAPCYLV